MRVLTTSSTPPHPLADVRTVCVSPGSSTKSPVLTPVLWGPSIVGYGSYHYVSQANPRTQGEWMKTGFSPRKAQLSLYGLKDLPEGAALLHSLGRYTEGAGCVYVKKLDDIDLDVLRRLNAFAWSRAADPRSEP